MAVNLGGRPKILDEEMLEAAESYIDKTKDITLEELPTLEGLAIELHINRETIYAWENRGETTEENPDPDEFDARFSNIVKKLREHQAQKLLQRALSNKYNPMIAKLMLSKHGYVERTETKSELIGKIDTGIQDPTTAAEFTEFMKGKTKQ